MQMNKLKFNFRSFTTSKYHQGSAKGQYIGRGIGIILPEDKSVTLGQNDHGIKMIDTYKDIYIHNDKTIKNPLIAWKPACYQMYVLFAKEMTIERRRLWISDRIVPDTFHKYQQVDEKKQIIKDFLKKLSINPVDPLEKYFPEDTCNLLAKELHRKTRIQDLIRPYIIGFNE